MPAIPLIGYAPDADPTTPGILTVGGSTAATADEYVATSRGIEAAPVFVAVTPQPAGGNPTGAVLVSTRGTRYIVSAGNSMYEFGGGAWTNVTAGGGPYGTLTTFCSFGNLNLAASASAAIQSQSTTFGSFGALSATAPAARIIVSAANFVLAFSTNDSSFGASPDRWWCSPIGNPAGVWTPSITTQANSGRLIEGGGSINAALPLGDQVVAYKQNAMFLGAYVGSPEVWRFERVPGEVGTLVPEAVCDIGGAHFIVGLRDCWIYDGVRPRQLGVGIASKDIFANTWEGTITLAQRRPWAVFDQRTRRVFFCVSSTSDPRIFTYDVDTGRFGLFRSDSSTGPTVSRMAIMAVSGVAGEVVPRIGGYNSTDVLRTVGTRPIRFTTHTFGVPDRVLMAKQVRAVGLTSGTSILGFAGNTQQTMTPTGSGSSSSSASPEKFDVRQTGRYHRFTVTGTGEATAIEVDFTQGGTR